MTKYDKADKLRKDCKADLGKITKITNDREKAIKKTDSIKERAEIDQMYRQRIASFEKKENRSYELYNSYIHSAFHRDDIEKALKLTRDFVSLRFLRLLQHFDQKRMKKGRQMSA